MHDFIIKAGRVNNLTDARYFSAMGVNWIGYDLNIENPEHLTPDKFKEIVDWVEGPKCIAEVGFIPPEDASGLYGQIQCDGFQFHALMPRYSGHDKGISFWREIIVTETTSIDEQLGYFDDQSETLVINLRQLDMSNHDQSRVWRQLQETVDVQQVILSLNLPITELKDFLSGIKPYGLELLGGSEEKTGYKSFDELDEVFDILMSLT